MQSLHQPDSPSDLDALFWKDADAFVVSQFGQYFVAMGVEDIWLWKDCQGGERNFFSGDESDRFLERHVRVNPQRG